MNSAKQITPKQVGQFQTHANDVMAANIEGVSNWYLQVQLRGEHGLHALYPRNREEPIGSFGTRASWWQRFVNGDSQAT